MDNADKSKGDGRLFSLDLLRGLDMLLLTVIGPFFVALDQSFELPKCFMRQFHHEWGGFTLWDIIMPLFIFMCGCAVPFALGKRLKDGKTNAVYWRHVASRFVLLWVLGMVAQGRLLSLDVLQISPFNNTLQTIACGYLAAAIVLPIKNRRIRAAIPVALALGYSLALHFCGDYTQTGNAAFRFEQWFVPFIVPSGSRVLELADPGYTWWLTIPMFCAMTLCGLEATTILIASEDPKRRLAKLAGLGAALLAVGWALVPVVPPIKHIYTFTFTAQAMGWSCLSLAFLFWLADIVKFRRGSWLVLLFGQTSLLAYMAGDEFKDVLRQFGKHMAVGFEHAFGPKSVPLGVWFFASVLLVAVLWLRRASRRRNH